MLLLTMYTCIYHDADVRNSIGITFGLIIFIPLTNRASPILRFQAGSAITMECICVHKYIYSDYIFYILQVHIT